MFSDEKFRLLHFKHQNKYIFVYAFTSACKYKQHSTFFFVYKHVQFISVKQYKTNNLINVILKIL